MQIIHVPHSTLRQIAQPVTAVTPELRTFIADLEKTLTTQRKPRGVGLSSPQVNESLRVFTTFLPEYDENGSESAPILKTYINPIVVSTSKHKTFGPDLDQPILEGCLSIPHLYGPVPRFEWVEYAFQVIENDVLKTKYATFYDFEARVMQHEYDHLEGILFTDYTQEFDLPLYDDSKGKMQPVKNKSLISKF